MQSSSLVIARRINVAISASVAALVSLSAQTHTQAADEIILKSVSVIGSSTAGNDSASQGTVTATEIEQRPLSRTGEVLESVPGMIVTQHSGEGKANQYFMRGYNLDHGTDFATWVAGMPANMPTHAHGQGYTDLNFLIPELISTVHYNKGPYSAEDGDFASAGSARINYAEKLPATMAVLSAGSLNSSRALLAGSPEFGPGRLVYGLEYSYSNGPWDNASKFHKTNAVLRYAQGDMQNGFNFTGMAYSANWNSTDQIAQRAVDSGLIGRYGALDPTDGGNSSRYSVSTEWRRTTVDTVSTFNAYAIHSKLNLYSDFTYYLDNPINGDQFEQNESRTTTGITGSHTWLSRWRGIDVSNTVGVQLRRDSIDPLALYSTQNRSILSVTSEDSATITSAAPYFSNTVQWNERLRTIAGIRQDYQRFEVSSDNPLNAGHASDSLRSPKFSLVLGPWARTEFYLNWGRGFHSNDARGTTITVDPKTGAAVDRVSPLVRTTGYEAGMRTQRIPNMTLSLALWQLRQNSELLFTGDAGTTEPSRASLRTGIELLAQYKPKDWLAFDTAIGLTRARFTDPDPTGNSIPGAPDVVVSAGVTAGRMNIVNNWYGALRWRYFGPRPLIEDNSLSSAATSLVNARVGYVLSKRTRVQADVFNLFNRSDSDIDYFYASRLPGEPVAGVNDVHFHPVQPRAVQVALVMTFE